MDRVNSNRQTTARQLAVLCLLVVTDISAAHTPSPSPSVSAVPSNSTLITGRRFLPPPSPHPNSTMSGDGPLSAEIIGAIAITPVFIVAGAFVIIVNIYLYYRKRRHVDSKWNLRKNQAQDKELGDKEMSPPDPHVSPNKQFHAGGAPLFRRQTANQPTRSHITLDVDDIYNCGYMMSGRSGISGLSEDDSMSCPPSPNVSSCPEDDDTERANYIQGEWSSYYNQGRVAPIVSVISEKIIPFNIKPTTGIPSLLAKYDSNQSEYHSSGYHSMLDNPHHHKYHHPHQDNRNSPHISRSRSRSRTPEYPHHPFVGQDRPQSFGPQYHLHRTLPNKGQTSFQSGAAPMRRSRSDDFGQSGTHGNHLHANRTESTQHLHCTGEALPPTPPPFQPTSGPNLIEKSHTGPPPPPTAAEDPHVMDRILLEAVSCLMHQDNCHIAGCQCREVKKRFQHIIPQTRLHVQRQTVSSTENLQSNNLNSQQQPKLSLSSQNLSPDIHTSNPDSPSSQPFRHVQPDDPSVKTPTLLSHCVPSVNQEEEASIFCGECPMPENMTLVTTLSDCTSEGVAFTDEANDFSLEIPEGAIPEEERLTVDLGVAIFGPFQFPEGLRPVSPVFWVCVRDNPNFKFPKPVTVTLPHFLDLESDEEIQSLGLTFLKADHKKNSGGLYNFQQTDGAMDFQPSQKYGTLRTTHFCSLCIACRDRPDVLTRTRFCITSVLPKTATVGQKQFAFFFITFYNLSTCLTKVDEIIAEKKLEHYEKTQVKFNFKRFAKNPGLEMVITQPKHGKIGLMGTQKILRSDVDFFIKKRTAEDVLRDQECKGFYPPRFQVFLASSPKNATLSDAKIKFKGAQNDLPYDIYLDVPQPSEVYPSPTPPSTSDDSISLDSRDLFKVMLSFIEAGMAAKWRAIGLALGLRNDRLDVIRSNNRTTEECLTAMATEWLNRAYDTGAAGEPTLGRLSMAVGNPAGGNNPAGAKRILQNWRTSDSSSDLSLVTETLC